jgi:two-component system, OmpR family, heavy metal sensor histidine kinase CusS
VRKWGQVSLATRVTTLVGITFLCCVVLLGIIVQNSISRHFGEEDADELRVVAASVQQALRGGAPTDNVQKRLERAVSGHHGVYFAVYDSRGNNLYSSPGPQLSNLLTKLAPVENINRDTLYQWSEDENTYRGAIMKVKGSDTEALDQMTIVVAASMNFHLKFIAKFRRTLWAILGCSSLIVLLSAWIAIRLAHVPLHRISEDIANITSEKLNVRLDPETVPSDLLELVTSFNDMLQRMDDLFRRLSNFSADIAHELRTPITNLTTQTQVSLGKARDVEEYQEILYSNLEEYERMARMINDMLWLAQADYGILKPTFETLDPAVEVAELFDYLGAWAEDCNVSLNLEGSCSPIWGDRAMLRQALTNLLTNAIRHSKPGTSICARLESEDHRARIVIENEGDNIPAEHLSKIFDRFYRIDRSRQRATIGSGTGLGLAIVSSIVTLHRGEVSASSENGRTAIQIALPNSIPSR